MDDVPTPLTIEDPIDQQEVLQYLYHNTAGEHVAQQDIAMSFHAQKPAKVRLSRLRSAYESKMTTAPLKYLMKRHEIIVDDDYLVDAMSPNLAWLPFPAHLDFLMLVPRQIGFHAILPRRTNDPDISWAFDFCIRRPQRVFTKKHGRLGFNPTGRALWIGRCQDMDVWLMTAPAEFVEDEDYMDDDEGTPVGNTRLSRLRYHMWLMFFAYLFNSCGILGIFINDLYPANIADPRAVTRNTNIL